MKGPRNNSKKNPPSDLSIPGIEVSQLEKLLDFMAAHSLEEFEYEHGGFHIRLRKASSGAVVAPIVAKLSEPPPAVPSSRPAAAEVQPPEPAFALPRASELAEDMHFIKSPIVGTFYAASSPETPPFLKEGERVHIGQVVCIVEAMKLMNEIESDVAGEVARVLVENGQPVEYGQPLFAIRPVKK